MPTNSLPDGNCSSSDWGYSYILSWISNATRMTKQEFANWRKIKKIQENDPNFINRYLMVLKSKEGVRVKKMHAEHNLKFELLSLLNPTEQKVIAEIVKGTQFSEIAKNIGIANVSFASVMTGIYKKTQQMISYGQRLKKSALLDYLFGKCGFVCGETFELPVEKSASETQNSPQDVVCEDCSAPEVTGEDPHIEQGSENKEREAVSVVSGTQENLVESLLTTLEFIEDRFKDKCVDFANYCIDFPCSTAEDTGRFEDVKIYKSAINVLLDLVIELKKGA